MNAQQIKQYVSAFENGYTLSIDLTERNLVVAKASILSVGMYVGFSDDDCGDLHVNWSAEGLTDNELADTMGMLLMRNLNSTDEVTAVMNAFYFEHAFEYQLKQILKDCGFSDSAVDNVVGSEWGMQDAERASYDAYDIADEIRAAMAA